MPQDTIAGLCNLSVLPTLAEYRAEQEAQTEILIQVALQRAGWRQREAARLLGVTPGALWQQIQRRPGLAAIVAKHGFGRGAPKKIAKTGT